MPVFDSNVTSRFFDDDLFRDLPSVESYISYLEGQFRLGSGKAGYMLTMILGEGLMLGPPKVREAMATRNDERIRYYNESFVLLHEEALAGDGEAMHFLAQYYQCGAPPLNRSVMAMFYFWVNKAKKTEFGRDRLQW
jgi:hypothetical protein